MNKGECEKTALTVSNLTVRYGQNIAISNVDLSVRTGEYLGIIGPNGGGKSTLLKAVLGLVPRESGEIKFFDNKTPKNYNKISYVPQISSVDRQFPILLSEVVLSGCLKTKMPLFSVYSKENKLTADEMIEKVGLKDLKNRQVSQLSGGEFQRMLIARALASKPQLLLLDEPTASVDAAARGQIYSLLSELNKEITIVLVTHDLLAVSSQVTRLACLNKTLIYHGDPQINETIVNNLYGCPVDLIAHGVPHRVLREHDHEGEGGCSC